MTSGGQALQAEGPSAHGVWRAGQAVLAGGLAIALLATFLLAWKLPALILLVPAAVVGLVLAVVLFRHPTLNLYVVLLTYVIVLDYEEGLQLREIIYGLYFMSFLAHWFITRLFLSREPVLVTTEDKALFLFLVGIVCSIPLSLINGAEFKTIVGDFAAMAALAFYFPIKEAIVRDRRNAWLMLFVVLYFGVFVAINNGLEYRSRLAAATQLYQIARGRVVANDSILMASSLVTYLLVLSARSWRLRIVSLGCFILCFSALILTQSRGYWVAFAFGSVVAFFLMSWGQRRRMVVYTALSGGLVLLVAFIFFNEYLVLIFGGLLERFTSIGSSVSRDISLRSRFYESAAVWKLIKQTPVLGHGMSVPYYFFDILSHMTSQRLFIHNGYVSLLYRFGLWGLLLVLVFWLRGIWRGIQASRIAGVRGVLRTGGLISASTLAAFLVSANTSNPLYMNDSTFIIALMAGIAGGMYARGIREKEMLRPEGPEALAGDRA